MIILLNFILFPLVAYSIGIWMNLSTFIMLIFGFLLAGIGLFLKKYKKKKFIFWLKFLSIFSISSYTIMVFTNIGFDLLIQKDISINLHNLILATVLIFALFMYYLLLCLKQTTASKSLDIKLDNILLKPSILLCLLVSLILTVLEMLLVGQLLMPWLAEKLLQRGLIPPITLLFFNWGLLLLFGKYLILFKIDDLNKLATDKNKKFWQMVQIKSEAFYVFPSYVNYALPILGFIGTVLGISLSSKGISQIISSPDGLSSTSTNLADAIAPLGIAFDTTLIALSLSLVLSLIFVLLQSYETKLLKQLEINDKQK